MNSFLTIIYALALGILPACFWLWFWLREDRLHPEPKTRIAIVFLTGMASVFLVLPIEKFIYGAALGGISLIVILIWAAVEEVFKYLAAYISALRGQEVDEPIDPLIYMITAALGFSALENALFLWNIIDVGFLPQSIITSNTRFLGASLLHIVSSSAIGVMLGLSFYKRSATRKIFLLIGLGLAVILHTLFNLFIIKLESEIFLVFTGVWVLIIVLIVLFEKIKSLKWSRERPPK